MRSAREDLRSLTQQEQEQEDRFRRWGHKPFVFQDAPLVEFRLVRLSDSVDGLFCKVSPHLVRWVGHRPAVVRNLHRLSDASRRQNPVAPSPLPTDFLAKEQEYRNSSAWQEDQTFWTEELRGLSLSENLSERSDNRPHRLPARLPSHRSSPEKSRRSPGERSSSLYPFHGGIVFVLLPAVGLSCRRRLRGHRNQPRGTGKEARVSV